MADLTQTAANVRQTSTTQIMTVTAGASVTPGMPVYRLAADGEYYPGDASALASADVKGIALGYADDGDPFSLAVGGDVDLGATLTVAEVYVVSDTAGAIMPAGDVSSGEFLTVLGVATTAGNLKLAITASRVARP